MVYLNHTPLCLAVLQGSLRTAQRLLAAGAQLQARSGFSNHGNGTFQMLCELQQQPQVLRAMAALLLSRGLPGEALLRPAHRYAIKLAYPAAGSATPPQPWMLRRLLELHTEQGAAGAEAQVAGATGALDAAFANLDMAAFEAWLGVPALRGNGLLQQLVAASDCLLFWVEGESTECAESAALLLLGRAATRQALRGAGAFVHDVLLAAAACAGRARVLERLLEAGAVISAGTFSRASPASVRGDAVHILFEGAHAVMGLLGGKACWQPCTTVPTVPPVCSLALQPCLQVPLKKLKAWGEATGTTSSLSSEGMPRGCRTRTWAPGCWRWRRRVPGARRCTPTFHPTSRPPSARCCWQPTAAGARWQLLSRQEVAAGAWAHAGGHAWHPLRPPLGPPTWAGWSQRWN